MVYVAPQQPQGQSCYNAIRIPHAASPDPVRSKTADRDPRRFSDKRGSPMRWVIVLWALPMGIFWGWYFLSLNDVNFGYVLMTRQFNELFFQLYGDMLGVEPATIPPLVAKACILDTALLLAIWAFRRRQALAAWYRGLRERYFGVEPSPSA